MTFVTSQVILKILALLSRGLRVVEIDMVVGVGRPGRMMAVLSVGLWTIGRMSVRTKGQIRTKRREAMQTQLEVARVLKVVGNMVVGEMGMFMEMLPAIP